MKFRLILDEAREASLNMALDELLMRRGEAALRFYRWSRPSATIGYFDDVKTAARLFGRKGQEIPVIRRITGGGAVLHGEDLTFSLVLRVPAPFFENDVKSSYLKINEAVRVGLQSEIPSMDYADCKTVPSQSSKQKQRVCFEAPSCYDLLLDGKKVLGGSQRRTHGVMLHQSTLFLPQPTAGAEQKIREGFEKVWKVDFEDRAFSSEELAEAARAESALLADTSRAYLPEGSFLRAATFLS